MGFLTDKLGPAPRYVWIVGGVAVAFGLSAVLKKRGSKVNSGASTAAADTTTGSSTDSGSTGVSTNRAGVGNYAGLVQALQASGMVIPSASPAPATAGGKVATPTQTKPAKGAGEPHKDAEMPGQSKNKKPVIHHAPVTQVSPKINARGGVGNKPYGPKAS